MSSGDFTKCDLSAGLAKLDLTVLKKQTENHFYSLMREMEKQVKEVINESMTIEDRKEQLLSMTSHKSKSIIRLSNQIAEVSELLHTLYNTDDREIEIVRE